MAVPVLLRGIFSIIMLLLSSLFGVFVYGGCFLPLFFVNPKLFRYFFDRMIGTWEYLCVALLELVLGIRVRITGDQIRPSEPNLIIMNHRTRLDWMYFWSVLVRQSGVKSEKIILKAPLKKIPGAGWAMQVGAFMFLDRTWDRDQSYLQSMLNYFSDLKHKTQVLIFPEGTDFSARTKARSDEFAKKNDWRPYDYCLHPRTTGFTFITELMRKNSHLGAVYDVTIGYPYNFPHSEPELVMGNVPREVHFHVRRYEQNDLPQGEAGLTEWCRERWEEKEDRLQRFYAADEDHRSFVDNHRGDAAPDHDPTRPDKLLTFALVYWTMFVAAISWILWYSWLARWLATAQVVFFFYMSQRHGGFELFQADYFNWFFKSRKSDEVKE